MEVSRHVIYGLLVSALISSLVLSLPQRKFYSQSHSFCRSDVRMTLSCNLSLRNWFTSSTSSSWALSFLFIRRA